MLAEGGDTHDGDVLSADGKGRLSKEETMDENERKYQKVVDALAELHADTSVSIETAITNMKGIKDECDVYIDALENDRKEQQRGGDDGD